MHVQSLNCSLQQNSGINRSGVFFASANPIRRKIYLYNNDFELLEKKLNYQKICLTISFQPPKLLILDGTADPFSSSRVLFTTRLLLLTICM